MKELGIEIIKVLKMIVIELWKSFKKPSSS